MILMIDNYDSFTYNLVQYFSELGAEVAVYRNDKITIEEIKKLNPEKIVISPGPATPLEAGISLDVIKHFHKTKPIFGVCLGHQSIGHAFGGNVIRAPKLMHGKTSLISHNAKDIFKGIENPFTATRYHSLIVETNSLPECLEITATTTETTGAKETIIMGLRHKEYPTFGVQFHPESILTESGKLLLNNFLSM